MCYLTLRLCRSVSRAAGSVWHRCGVSAADFAITANEDRRALRFVPGADILPVLSDRRSLGCLLPLGASEEVNLPQLCIV